MKRIFIMASCLFSISQLASASTDVHAYIISPADGEEVSSPFKVSFGLQGMGVAPAGVDKPNTGHHHLIIDDKLADYAKPIPKDSHHMHFGGGQTETTLDLPPGKHTLQLILGDKGHVPHKTPVQSEVITVMVK